MRMIIYLNPRRALLGSRVAAIPALSILILLLLVALARSQTAAYSLLDSISAVAGGTEPQSIVLGSDGNYYGTTETGGSSANTDPSLGVNRGEGTIFKMTPEGAVTILHSFDFSDGSTPIGPLVEGNDGTFYGTTTGSGSAGNGTIFSITPNGALITLHTFSAISNNRVNSDGAQPSTGLVLGSGNTLYGTTPIGGANGVGTIFSITTSGTFTSLYSFAGADGSPAAALIAGPGGFYGGTDKGGMYGSGTVFKFVPPGTLDTLYSFTKTNASGENADGRGPLGLVLGQDGIIYGVTAGGGFQCRRHRFLPDDRRYCF